VGCLRANLPVSIFTFGLREILYHNAVHRAINNRYENLAMSKENASKELQELKDMSKKI
jgi:hypothetical protein